MTLTRLAKLLAALLAVLTAAEVGVRLVDDRLPEPVTWYHEIAQAKTEQMEDHDGDVDVVFAGTSQSYHGIDPEVVDEHLGTRSYNAGIPAGVPTLQRRWLFDAVLPNLDAETVVWAISSVDLNAARPQEMAPVYDSAFTTRGGLLAAVDRWLFDRSALFEHRRTIADPQSWFAEDGPLDEARRVLLSSGKRRPGSPNTSDAERRRMRRQVIGDFEPGGRMSRAIVETVEELRARDIEVVMVWLPEAPRYLDLLPGPEAHREARREADRLARRLDVPLLDVSDGYGDDDFIDFTHLDGEAADRLSTVLASELAPLRRTSWLSAGRTGRGS